jgi:hypothetical protein
MIFMKLQQGQVWKLEEQFIRIVLLERLAVEYKVMKNLETRVGIRYRVTKKQFCALIKPASLIQTEKPALPASQ